jgi:hypothetical protein
VSHSRKYGNGDSHPIPVWNGIFDHQEQIGIALWTFLWLIDRIPKDCEQNGVGKVLGGRPIKIAEIVETVSGATYDSIRGQLDRLERRGYINRRRTPYGFVIEVRNSQKWGVWKARESWRKPQSLNRESLGKPQSGGERVWKNPTQSLEKPQNKENTAAQSSRETQQEKTAAPESLIAWRAIGSNLPMGTAGFQKIHEHYFGARNGDRISDAMERTIQAANKRAVKVPPPYFEKKRAVERQESRGPGSATSEAVPVLRVESWA